MFRENLDDTDHQSEIILRAARRSLYVGVAALAGAAAILITDIVASGLLSDPVPAVVDISPGSSPDRPLPHVFEDLELTPPGEMPETTTTTTTPEPIKV